MRSSLRIIKRIFVTQDGHEIEGQELSDEEYFRFCTEFEASRLSHEIRWRELDGRYAGIKSSRSDK